MTSELQRDLELIAGLLWDKGTMQHWEAWQRIRQRLTPDRERVARAIYSAASSFDNQADYWGALADAAIAAMGEP